EQLTGARSSGTGVLPAAVSRRAGGARRPGRHVITNAVGGIERGVNPGLRHVRLRPGGAVVLCSDGLTGMLPDEEILAELRAADSLRTVCERLVSRAN